MYARKVADLSFVGTMLANASHKAGGNLNAFMMNFSPGGFPVLAGKSLADPPRPARRLPQGRQDVAGLTFLVNSTNSPAYVSTPVTTSSTWPSVLRPDALTIGQATAGLGPYYSLGLTAGDVQTAHMMGKSGWPRTPLDRIDGRG